MRASEHFALGRSQPELDFVDVDIFGDTRVFVDPRALRLLPSTWGDECVALVQNFFAEVLRHIHDGRDQAARTLLSFLREPNETHLGLSRARAQGRALGTEKARDVWEALTRSEAVKSGLLEDLEDTILMVEGISADIVSDMTTNIIRQPLIRYTQDACTYYGIPLRGEVPSGPLWDPKSCRWDPGVYVRLPWTTYGKLLLVPKAVVRVRMDYDPEEYYRHYILEHLMEAELRANTELVQLLKDGRRRVTKKDLIAKYGTGKAAIVRHTRAHPELLERYRSDKRRHLQPPLDHQQIAELEGTAPPDWDTLLGAVRAVPPGQSAFAEYERAIEGLLSALFYPSLTNPHKQVEIHEGRKRIDISYTNTGTHGFFCWVAQHYPAANIFVECKNYSRDIANPELDQLAGRFSPSRGKVGLLLCRAFADKETFLKRCRDTASDDRGFVIPLDDEDLAVLVSERRATVSSPRYQLLWDRFRSLTM